MAASLVNHQLNLRFLLLAVGLLLLSSSIQAKTTVKYCDRKANYDVKVSGVEISPDPVVKGEPATFKMSASSVYARVMRKAKPAGSGPKQEAYYCVGPGHEKAPNIGSYTLKMIMEDEKDNQLTCVRIAFKIGVATSEEYSSV